MGSPASETSFTMLRLLVLVVAVSSGVLSLSADPPEPKICKDPAPCTELSGSIECMGDCDCGDTMADECGRPHPTTAVHVSSIVDCMANCQVFALEDRCKFIIFHYDNIDENCIIMNNEFDDYIGHCNIRGSALWSSTEGEGIGRFKDDGAPVCKSPTECANDLTGEYAKCKSCKDCSADACSGFMLSDCQIFSKFQERSEILTWDTCEIFGRNRAKSTFALFNKEEGFCEVYGDELDGVDGDGVDRECKVAMVKLGTDPIACGGL